MKAGKLVWLETSAGLQAVLRTDDGEEHPVSWAPQPGSQQAFLSCPVFEALLEGNRGGGKTDTLLVDFLQHVGKGFGAAWRGVLFRRTYPELEDVIGKSKAIFWRAYPKAKYNEAKSFWEFPTGERLYFRQFYKPADYWKFHGHAYPWIGWEELTTWPNDTGYKMMLSCARSARKDVPIKVRATTNPYGVGHTWVKRRFRLPNRNGATIGPIITDSVNEQDEEEPPRVSIHSSLLENRVLLFAQPNYLRQIRAAAENPQQEKAWLEGDWDITSGGMFDDLFNRRVHVIAPFQIPATWKIDRAFDWGSSRPFSCGWWAESDGSDVRLPTGDVIHTIRGDLFRVAEWYGWSGRKENEGIKMDDIEVAAEIKERERQMWPDRRVMAGPADTQIFDDSTSGTPVATLHRRKGISWIKADKSPGSRKNGWLKIRSMLRGSDPRDEHGKPIPRERAGLFIFNNCDQWLRTVPVLPRSDKDPDEIADETEDHAADETRYRCYRGKSSVGTKTMRGR